MMSSLEIFLTQLMMSILAFSLFAKWYVWPWLSQKTNNQALILLIAPHVLRHMGLSFLVPTVADAQIPMSFANAAAYGDFISALLALLALVALRKNWGIAFLLVAFFNVIGFMDLINALRQAEAIPYLAATWFIPTFFVPVLLVSHIMIFVRLLGMQNEQGA